MSVLSVADVRTVSPEHSSPRSQQAVRSRPALQVLPKVKGRQKGLIAGVILLLAAALAAVLALNIHIANAQYSVVQMQNEHQSLVHQNQALTQQVQFLESPQSLSNAAVTLGMVMPAAAGTLDLASGDVIGSAESADSSHRPSNFVAAPVLPGQDVSAAVDVAQQAEGSPTGLLGVGALETLMHDADGHNGGEEAQADRRFGSQDLEGGTSPAPKLIN